VQRRGDRADDHRQAVHGRQDLHEVAGLQRLQDGQRTLAVLSALGEDEILDQLAALAKKHVLGTGQAYSFGTEPAGARRPGRRPRWRARQAGAWRRRGS